MYSVVDCKTMLNKSGFQLCMKIVAENFSMYNSTWFLFDMVFIRHIEYCTLSLASHHTVPFKIKIHLREKIHLYLVHTNLVGKGAANRVFVAECLCVRRTQVSIEAGIFKLS